MNRAWREGRTVLFLAAVCVACSDSPVEPDPVEVPDLSGLQGSIFFLSDREHGNTPTGPSRTELFVIRPDGTGERQLTENDVWDNIGALTSVHPSGNTVTFERLLRTNPGVTLDIVSASLDGTLTEFTRNYQNRIQNEWVTDPQWAPDGSGVLITVQEDSGSRKIYYYPADGSERRLLLPHSGTVDWNPRWSPTGEWIAFLSSPNKLRFSCWVMRLDGSGLREIQASGFCEPAVWAPDGSELFFAAATRFDREDFSLWRANADGSNPTLLIPSQIGMKALVLPVASPDGAHLAFVATGQHGTWDIFLASTDGSNVRTLVTSEGDDYNVSFSPDGSHFVFETTRFGLEDARHGFSELMVQAVDDGEPVRITNTTHNRNPFWVPGR